MTDVVFKLENIDSLPLLNYDQSRAENSFILNQLKPKKLLTSYLKHEEELIQMEYEDKKIIYGMKSKNHNPHTHVKVRVLYNEEGFSTDLSNGQRFIDSSLTETNLS